MSKKACSWISGNIVTVVSVLLYIIFVIVYLIGVPAVAMAKLLVSLFVISADTVDDTNHVIPLTQTALDIGGESFINQYH